MSIVINTIITSCCNCIKLNTIAGKKIIYRAYSRRTPEFSQKYASLFSMMNGRLQTHIYIKNIKKHGTRIKKSNFYTIIVASFSIPI